MACGPGMARSCFKTSPVQRHRGLVLVQAQQARATGGGAEHAACRAGLDHRDRPGAGRFHRVDPAIRLHEIQAAGEAIPREALDGLTEFLDGLLG